MLNTDEIETETDSAREASVQRTARAGAIGAIALAGIASLVVMAIWFAFYLLVFVPRAGAP